MKILRAHSGRANETGMVTVIFIALLGIMLILVTAESKALFHLHREVKLLEQKQIQHWSHPATNATNTVTRLSGAVPPQAENPQ